MGGDLPPSKLGVQWVRFLQSSPAKLPVQPRSNSWSAPESVKQRAAASSACDSRCRLPALAVDFSSPMPAGLPAATWFGCPATCSLQPPAKWMSALSLHLASGGPHLQDARSAIPCCPRQQDVRSVGCRYVGLYVDFGCRRAGTVRDEACSLLYRTSISILSSDTPKQPRCYFADQAS